MCVFAVVLCLIGVDVVVFDAACVCRVLLVDVC